MTLDDLQSLDVNNIGSWPLPIRILVVLLVCAGIGAAGYYFLIEERLGVLEASEAKEPDLRQKFEIKQRKAANLDAYKAQLNEMEVSFSVLLRQLPGKSEVASLLQDVSRVRVASGLDEELFKPGNEQELESYAELPVQIDLLGGFNQFGGFAAEVAALSRIVTLDDIAIAEPGGRDAPVGRLRMNATARTYRYLEEEAE